MSFGFDLSVSLRPGVQGDVITSLPLDGLDTVDSEALEGVWSFRRLLSSYSGALIRIRRSSDNAEQDFGSSQDEIDSSEVATFVGGGSGFVATIYDQLGANDLVQTSSSLQPLFVGASINGKPGANFNGSSQFMVANGVASAFSGTDLPLSILIVADNDAMSGNQVLFGLCSSSDNDPLLMLRTNASAWELFQRGDETAGSPGGVTVGTTGVDAGHAHIIRYTGTAFDAQIGGDIVSSTDFLSLNGNAVTFDRFGIGALPRASVGQYHDGDINEAVLFSRQISELSALVLSSSVENYFGIEMPSVGTLSASVLQKLPDVASGGPANEGFTCTGVDYDDDDDALWIANDGRATPGDSSYEPSLVQVNLSGTSILAEISLTSLFPSAESIQGVAVDESDSTLWFASVAENLIRHVTKAGVDEEDEISVTAPNGLCYDSTRDALWYTNGSTLRRISKAGSVQATVTLPFAEVDMLFYDAVNDLIWITSGANGEIGILRTYNPSNGAIGEHKYRLTEATAIEGAAIQGSVIYIAHDGFFHSASAVIDENQLQIYAMPSN